MTPEVLLCGSVAVVVAVGMEPWSRIVHDRLWHGVLWPIHRSHHPEPMSDGLRLEWNDLFVLMHVAVAVGTGLVAVHWVPGLLGAAMLGVAVGMSMFGMSYFVVHDGLAHGRLPVRFLLRFRWARRIRAAHEIHHRTGGAPYGLFDGPGELRRSRQAERARSMHGDQGRDQSPSNMAASRVPTPRS